VPARRGDDQLDELQQAGDEEDEGEDGEAEEEGDRDLPEDVPVEDLGHQGRLADGPGTDNSATRTRAGARRPLVVYGANPVRELLRSPAPVARVCLGSGAYAAELAAAAAGRGIAVETVDRATLDRLAGSPHHQGAVAVGAPFRYASLEAVVAPPSASALVLDGVQDPRNLGAILRTARAFGVGGWSCRATGASASPRSSSLRPPASCSISR
jgi:hypothetical protein